MLFYDSPIINNRLVPYLKTKQKHPFFYRSCNLDVLLNLESYPFYFMKKDEKPDTLAAIHEYNFVLQNFTYGDKQEGSVKLKSTFLKST